MPWLLVNFFSVARAMNFKSTLVWYLRNSLHNSIVIPGNPGSQFGVARRGIQEFQRLWIPASAGMTAKNVTNNLTDFWITTLNCAVICLGQSGLLIGSS